MCTPLNDLLENDVGPRRRSVFITYRPPGPKVREASTGETGRWSKCAARDKHVWRRNGERRAAVRGTRAARCAVTERCTTIADARPTTQARTFWPTSYRLAFFVGRPNVENVLEHSTVDRYAYRVMQWYGISRTSRARFLIGNFARFFKNSRFSSEILKNFHFSTVHMFIGRNRRITRIFRFEMLKFERVYSDFWGFFLVFGHRRNYREAGGAKPS